MAVSPCALMSHEEGRKKEIEEQINSTETILDNAIRSRKYLDSRNRLHIELRILHRLENPMIEELTKRYKQAGWSEVNFKYVYGEDDDADEYLYDVYFHKK